jgi:hypothetical protein
MIMRFPLHKVFCDGIKTWDLLDTLPFFSRQIILDTSLPLSFLILPLPRSPREPILIGNMHLNGGVRYIYKDGLGIHNKIEKKGYIYIYI